MPATEAEITEALRELDHSHAYKAAAKALGFAALCIVSTVGRQRRRWDDNEGAHPTRLVVTTGDPRRAVETYNRGVHSIEGVYHTLAHIWLPSRAHGERMKAWIEEQIKADPMLNGWSDLAPWQFEIMFGAAAEALRYDAFDDNEKHRRVLARARRSR